MSQVTLLSLSRFFELGIAFAISATLARLLGAEEFGVYAFTIAFFSFAAMFFELGLFTAASRLMAQSDHQSQIQKILGASFITLGVIAILFALFSFSVSYIVEDLFKIEGTSSIVRNSSYFAFALILPQFVKLICEGAGRIIEYSRFNLVNKLLFACLLIYALLENTLNVQYAIYAHLGSFIIAILSLMIMIRPDLSNGLKSVRSIYIEAKVFGINIYLSRLIDMMTFRLDTLMLAYFSGPISVGVYSMAYRIANPVSYYSSSLASSNFKEFANADRIDRKHIAQSYRGSALLALIALASGFVIMQFFLGEEFQDRWILISSLVIAVFFQGAYQTYLNWLVANGHKNQIRKKTYITASVNLVLNFVLIPIFGAEGAALASLVSMLSSFFLYRHFYLSNVEPNENVAQGE